MTDTDPKWYAGNARYKAEMTQERQDGFWPVGYRPNSSFARIASSMCRQLFCWIRSLELPVWADGVYAQLRSQWKEAPLVICDELGSLEWINGTRDTGHLFPSIIHFFVLSEIRKAAVRYESARKWSDFALFISWTAFTSNPLRATDDLLRSAHILPVSHKGLSVLDGQPDRMIHAVGAPAPADLSGCPTNTVRVLVASAKETRLQQLQAKNTTASAMQEAIDLNNLHFVPLDVSQATYMTAGKSHAIQEWATIRSSGDASRPVLIYCCKLGPVKFSDATLAVLEHLRTASPNGLCRVALVACYTQVMALPSTLKGDGGASPRPYCRLS
jgi:hypothetical protein